jgi:phosphatidylserine/phosphatidylglycerophosphate/cardiolipin synthase-like enzyme
VHFPYNADKKGKFTYRVTPLFMDATGTLSRGQEQTAAIALMRETLPGKVNVAFTRGFVSSQAFVDRFSPDGKISTLVPDTAKKGLTFKPTHKDAEKALSWMGFEARSAIFEVLDAAIKKKAKVRVIAYDLNMPEIVDRLVKLKSRLQIIIDDSDSHKEADAPETLAEKRLIKSAGAGNVLRQHMSNLQHHKSIAVQGTGINKVIYGSTNFSWRGFYVQSNNAFVVNSEKAVKDYFTFFDSYFGAKKKPAAFKASKAATGWHKLAVPGLNAQVAFSPHTPANGVLGSIGKDIDKAKSCVLFSLAFLGQTKKGSVGPALGRKMKSKTVHTLGIADARVKGENLGLAVYTPENQRKVVRSAALTKGVPPPFSTEPSGLSGGSGQHRGTRMHHKFVVIDFDTPDARVYFGSYNFSEPADLQNGENLVLVKDRTVATSYMIEAVRIYDHYRFRTVQEDVQKGKKPDKTKKAINKVITLLPAPKKPTEKAWWQSHWEDRIRKRERELFA